MKSVLLLLLITLSLPLTLPAQTLSWARQISSPNNEQPYAIRTDAANNVFYVGEFEGTVDFDPGPGTVNLTATGQRDIFFTKLNAAGNHVWTKSFGGNRIEVANDMILDDMGNIYMTGEFTDTTDFDPGPAVANLVPVGSSNAFVCKFDANGNYVWARSFPSPLETTFGLSIAVDTAGNVITAGTFKGTADFDPGVGVRTLSSFGSWETYISKLDANGNYVWAKRMGGALGDYVLDLSLDGAGNIYTTGYFLGTADFDPDVLATFNMTSVGSHDAYVSKLDAAGNFKWAKRLGGTASDIARLIEADSVGNVVISGYYAGTADFDPGSGTSNLISVGASDIFVCKLDSAGDFVWARSMGGSANESPYGLVMNDAGDVYTTGSFWGTGDFDPGTGTANLNSFGGFDIYVSKLDANGDFVSVGQMGGTGFDFGLAMTLDALGEMCITGSFQLTADMDPGMGVDTLVSAGASDIFVLKLFECNESFSTEVITACDSFVWIDSLTYYASNNSATFMLTNAVGCDSIITLDLTLNTTSQGTDIVTACDSFRWIDNVTYVSSTNTPTFLLTNSKGCDSLVTLDLTITSPSTGIDQVTACDSYTWIDNNTYTSSNTTATFTLSNAAGCDSVMTLNLTINSANGSTDQVTACDSFTWIDNITYTSSNNTATRTFSNAAGCDSVVQLDLTIKTVNIGISQLADALTADAIGATYQWINCDNGNASISGATTRSFTPDSSGNYAVIVTQNACSDTSVCVSLTKVGIDKYPLATGMTLFPNPGNGHFTLGFGQVYQDIEVQVFNLLGQEVSRFQAVGTDEVKVTIPGPDGGYILLVRADGQVGRLRAVVR